MWGNKSKMLLAVVLLACLCSTSAMALSQRIGDCVWFDANGDGKTTNDDGTMQAGEYGLNGVTVTLVYHNPNTGQDVLIVPPYTTGNYDGYPLTDKFPAPSGFYTFEELDKGRYTVTLSNVPAGLVPTWAYDHVPTVPYTYSAEVEILGDKPILTVDFGFNYTGPILYEVGDRVWHDANNDGVQDEDEAGINGATVRLLDEDGNAIATTTTATVNGIEGYYLFTAPRGKYIIEVSGTPVGWACTYDLDDDGDSNSGLFTLSANRYDVDFGYCDTPSTGYCTFTQGGWGSKPHGNNPGALLEKHFADVYPNGLNVGEPFKLNFISAVEISNFLPQGGTAASLTQNYPQIEAGKRVWAKKTEAGVLAGQVVALRLNVDFAQHRFTPFGLGSRIIQYGTYNWTVANFLREAEKVLGGETSKYFTISEINYIATQINESFDNGTTNTGFVK